jgi:lipid-A-disaccharide synthase
MEPPIYARHGVAARFVGHPLAEAFANRPDQAAARATLQLPAQGPVLALLPGSRRSEIRRLLPTFLEAARQLAAEVPGLQVVVPAANARCQAQIEEQLKQDSVPGLRVTQGRAHEAMVAADAVLLASGTAALEAMLAKRPMVVGYRISSLTFRLVMGLGLMNSNRYSLPNVLANEPIVPELMQQDCTPENLVAALRPAFLHPDPDSSLESRFLAIHQRLRGPAGGASQAAADAIAELLGSP